MRRLHSRIQEGKSQQSSRDLSGAGSVAGCQQDCQSASISVVEAELAAAQERARIAEARADAAEARLRTRQTSLCWRIIGPVQAFWGWLMTKGRQGTRARERLWPGVWLRLAVRFVLTRPRLRSLGFRIMARLPRLQRRMERALLGGGGQGLPSGDGMNTGGHPLPPSIRRIRRALLRSADLPDE